MNAYHIVGTATLDVFLNDLAELPSAEGDEFTAGSLLFCPEPVRFSLGGNGAISAFVLARLGAEVKLYSAVGNDPPGQMVRNWLIEASVDCTNLSERPAEATSSTLILSDRRRSRVAFHHQGASAAIGTEADAGFAVSGGAALLVTGYPLLSGLDPGRASHLLASARARGCRTALDIGPAVGRAARLSDVRPLLGSVDFLFCNEHELRVLTGRESTSESVFELLEAGADCVVLKLGTAGSRIQSKTRGESVLVPGFPVQARSTVGAGDTFNAGFLWALGQGRDLEASARFGNAAAALVISADRGVLSCPGRDEIESLAR